MSQQNYRNHARYYPFHHFVITPLTLVYFIWTLIKMDFSSSETISDGFYQLIGALILVLLPLLARLYALKLQNRMILNEMRIRYFHLTGKSFDELEEKLTQGQIIALRFASDDEILGMINQAIDQKTSPKEIKKSIKDWRGDYRRV